MLENGTGGEQMIAIAGRILLMVDEKTDFLVTDDSLSEEEKHKM